VASAQISISLPPFDENTLNLSFPCNKPTIAAHKRSTIALLPQNRIGKEELPKVPK
jgi:hypothetical protein